MNYQAQKLIQTMMSVMTLGVCMGPPRVMFQAMGEHSKKRQELTDKYGLWEVNRSIAVCPRNDWGCIESESSRLAGLLRSRYW